MEIIKNLLNAMKNKNLIFNILVLIGFGIYGCSLLNKNETNCITKSQIINFTKVDSLLNLGKLDLAKANFLNYYNKTKNEELAYRLARIYSIKNIGDSALYYLNISIQYDSTIYRIFNGDFYYLIDNPIFNQLVEFQFNKYEVKHGDFQNKQLTKKLMYMRMKDQAYYYHWLTLKENIEYYRNLKIELNKENLEEAISILDSIGWPSTENVGVDASSVVFLILHHSASNDIKKKYLPLLENLIKTDSLQKPSYAYFIDRILQSEGKKQIYGSQLSFDTISQVYFLSNVERPDSLDYRRLSMGLDSISSYLELYRAELRIYDK